METSFYSRESYKVVNSIYFPTKERLASGFGYYKADNATDATCSTNLVCYSKMYLSFLLKADAPTVVAARHLYIQEMDRFDH